MSANHARLYCPGELVLPPVAEPVAEPVTETPTMEPVSEPADGNGPQAPTSGNTPQVASPVKSPVGKSSNGIRIVAIAMEVVLVAVCLLA
jgi:hypothetical protein